jgi:hypothetical protein
MNDEGSSNERGIKNGFPFIAHHLLLIAYHSSFIAAALRRSSFITHRTV